MDMRSTYFTSPATGITYWIDDRGIATQDVEPEPYAGCECEMDWNCGCGRFGGATWLEVRYAGRDD